MKQATPAILILLMASTLPAFAERVPVPRPRPTEASAAVPPRAADAPSPVPTSEAAPAPPSACRLALTDKIAIAPSLPPIRGPGECGAEDLVSLEAVVLADGRKVSVKPAATLRCPMARAIADWVRADVNDAVRAQGQQLAEIDNFDSYECRGRNRVQGARVSEHGKGNALDIRGFRLASGDMLSLTARTAPQAFRERIRQSVCARFMTVLGPQSDGYHEDHVHVDLAQRRGDYRMCRWAVLVPDPPKAGPVVGDAQAKQSNVVEQAKDEGRKQDDTAPDGFAARWSMTNEGLAHVPLPKPRPPLVADARALERKAKDSGRDVNKGSGKGKRGAQAAPMKPGKPGDDGAEDDDRVPPPMHSSE